MAIDSILGGSGTTLTDSTRDVLTGILQDSIGGTTALQTVPGGTVVVSEGAGHESQLGVVANSGSLQANISTGSFSGSISLPQGTVAGVQGPGQSQTVDQTQAYLNTLASQAIQDTGYRTNLLNSVQNVLTGGSDTVVAGQISTRVMQLGGSTTGGQSFVVSGAGNASIVGGSQQLLVIDTSHAPNATVQLSGVSNAVVAGNSTVLISPSLGAGGGDTGGAGANAGTVAGTAISGDMFNQSIVGGSGRDTIFGGGGFDTVTGGTGPDVFGIAGQSASDRLTIADFGRDDQLLIKMAGIHSVESLLGAISGVTHNGPNSSTLLFANGSAVTLVGISLADITLDMIKFG